MYSRYIKRLIDLLLCIILLPVILIILIACSILIKVEDRGPILYAGKRLGLNGKIFKMYKLRTMKVNAPDLRNTDGSTFNSDEDSRLTKVGRVLRKISLDELPQIFNVLIGDMSFIGPRPDLPEHIHYYNQEESRKLSVLPGISGYNQAYFRNSIKWKERIKNDIYYVDNISFLLDVKIFVKTIIRVSDQKGIYVTKQVNSEGNVNIND